jgi:hypothetical protein
MIIKMWFLDPDGKPVLMDVLAAIDLIVDGDYHKRRIVKQETIGPAEVSTVFIGGLAWPDERARPLWETMIFGGPFDGRATRYETQAAAVIGHEEIAAILRAGEGL